MNAIKYLAFFLFVAVANGVDMEPKKCLMDPWGEAREMCRKQCGLTPEHLRMGCKNMKSVAPFLVCMGDKLENINKDGTINKECLIKNLAPLNPETITRPIIDCCVERVYKGKIPDHHEVGMYLAEFVTCYKKLVPKSMFNVIGLLEPPFYHRLSKCKNCC